MSFYVTTPIYYVNSTPHIGHAYTTIAADIVARHRRQRGEETFFLTGTDEHGSNIPRVAEEAGLELREFVDRNAAAFQEMTVRVNASNDFFVRTTDDRHKARVQEFLQRIYDRGDIFEGVYAGLYCTRCESFYTEAELVDGPVPPARDPARVRRGEELLLPPLRLPGAPSAAVRRPAGHRASAVSLQRGAQLHRAGAGRHQRQPCLAALGRGGAVGHQPGGLRLGGRAHQLLERARLRPAGRGPPAALLARGPPPSRQGHPQVPLRDLAGPAARGRARGAEAAVRARVPAPGRAQDREVDGERDRPARPDRRLRGRPAPLLPLPRGHVRAGREHLRRGPARALRARARERPRQPPLPDDGDDRALSGREPANGGCLG